MRFASTPRESKYSEDEREVEKHGELGLGSIGLKGMETVPMSVQMNRFETYEALLDSGVPIQKLARLQYSERLHRRLPIQRQGGLQKNTHPGPVQRPPPGD
jgi:hypothetical protein